MEEIFKKKFLKKEKKLKSFRKQFYKKLKSN